MEHRITRLDRYNWIDQLGKFKVEQDPKRNTLKIEVIEDNSILSLNDLIRIDSYFAINSLSQVPGGNTGTETRLTNPALGVYNDFEIAFANGLGQTPHGWNSNFHLWNIHGLFNNIWKWTQLI